MRRIRLVTLCLALVLSASLALAGCSGVGMTPSQSDGAWSENGGEAAGIPPGMPSVTPTVPSPQRPSENSDEDYVSGPEAPDDRMVVRSGFMELVVDDVVSTAQTVSGLATTFGGHVVSSSVYRESGHTFGSVVIRVDAHQFESALSAIRSLAVEVARESTSGTDVTEEYIDLSARTRNLQATEQQLLALMEQAGTVEELLEVQREVSNVRGEIERLEARIRYLEQTSAMSLIEVYLRESVLTVTFSADVRAVKEGESVAFSPEVSGGFLPYSYAWDFGDGETSNEASPSHIYGDEGFYNVRLTVTDDRGTTASYFRDYYIQVEGVWSPADVFRNAAKGLGSLGRGILSLGIWFIVYTPVWLVLGGIAYLLYRRAMRRHSDKEQKS